MIVSIGEVVWDIFDDKKVLGGAPVNVAYHLRSLGLEVSVITKVGKDDLGKATKARLQEMDLDLKGVQEGELPTGRVNVTIGRDNEPHFDIVAPAAWDAIDIEQALKVLDGSDFHLVFGTLAQRDPISRKTIRRLWEMADKLLYDVNLRPPFTTKELVSDSLKVADMVKVNSEELNVLASWFYFSETDKRELASQLLAAYDISVMVVTEGKDGAWLVTADQFFMHPGSPVQVADTVGAGDAFFATVIEGYINKRPWPECLAHANKRGAYVAARKGATPPMPENI